jgi:hypothetical protein
MAVKTAAAQAQAAATRPVFFPMMQTVGSSSIAHPVRSSRPVAQPVVGGGGTALPVVQGHPVNSGGAARSRPVAQPVVGSGGTSPPVVQGHPINSRNGEQNEEDADLTAALLRSQLEF